MMTRRDKISVCFFLLTLRAQQVPQQPMMDATILMIRRSAYTMVATQVALRTTLRSEQLAESKNHFEGNV